MNGTCAVPDLGQRVFVADVIRAEDNKAGCGPSYHVVEGIVNVPRNEFGLVEIQVAVIDGRPVIYESCATAVWNSAERAVWAVYRAAAADLRERECDVKKRWQTDGVLRLSLLRQIDRIEFAFALFLAAVKDAYGIDIAALATVAELPMSHPPLRHDSRLYQPVEHRQPPRFPWRYPKTAHRWAVGNRTRLVAVNSGHTIDVRQ
ncbi:hypothetical protein EPN42_06225 [bacterium]|nr:MAG: hypothetical protein EPN42_06225 [bacterium]